MIYIIITLLTIFFSSRADLMYENITGVLILPSYRFYTMIFIIFLAWFFGLKVFKLFRKYNMSNRYSYSIFLTSLTMTIGAISPYTLNSNDVLSHLHVYCSILSSISFLVHLFIFFDKIKNINPIIHEKLFPYYQKGIEFLILLTIVFGRMNGYIEIIYSIIVCSILFFLEKN